LADNDKVDINCLCVNKDMGLVLTPMSRTREPKNAVKILFGKPDRRDHLGDLGVYGWIVLKWILKWGIILKWFLGQLSDCFS
jgi:hypothetical protein